MLTIRAGYFNVFCEEQPQAVAASCKAHVAFPPQGEFEVEGSGGKIYRLTDCAWDDDNGVLTGTMWRVRQNNLPSELVGGQVKKILNDLGESSSFAYMPARREALIQYNHHGPRHAILGTFLEKVGVPGAVFMTPVVTEGALARMQNAHIVKRIEYSLGNIAGHEEALRGAGVGAVVDELKSLHGAHIRVEVSLGHDGGSLGDRAKEMMGKLAAIANAVKTVKVGVKEGEGKTTEILDLIGGRLYIDLSVLESGREMDRAECREKLAFALLNRQVTSDEEADDDEPEADAVAAADES